MNRSRMKFTIATQPKENGAFEITLTWKHETHLHIVCEYPGALQKLHDGALHIGDSLTITVPTLDEVRP